MSLLGGFPLQHGPRYASPRGVPYPVTNLTVATKAEWRCTYGLNVVPEFNGSTWVVYNTTDICVKQPVQSQELPFSEGRFP